ncbi:hypothetical protein YIM1640_01610 [Thermus oshimai]
MRRLFPALKALPDPKAPLEERRRGLRAYALGLLSFHGLVLLLLLPLLPAQGHPFLWGLALLGLGGVALWVQGSLREEGPSAPLVAVGLGGAGFFFLGVMGLLLRPEGLFLLLLGGGFFLLVLRSAEAALARPQGSPGSGGGPGPGSP